MHKQLKELLRFTNLSERTHISTYPHPSIPTSECTHIKAPTSEHTYNKGYPHRSVSLSEHTHTSDRTHIRAYPHRSVPPSSDVPFRVIHRKAGTSIKKKAITRLQRVSTLTVSQEKVLKTSSRSNLKWLQGRTNELL